MDNKESLQVIRDASFGEHFLKPQTNTYSFARIPDTIRHVFGDSQAEPLPGSVLGDLSLDGIENVVLLLVDAFGWRFLERYTNEKPHDTLCTLRKSGTASKLTSQFPSTTAAHVTTIHTGIPVGQSGVYEWFYYDQKSNRVVAPLLFSPAGHRLQNSLLETGMKGEDLLPAGVHYPTLRRHGVTSYVIQPESFLEGEFDRVATFGAERIGYATYQAGLQKAVEVLQANSEKKYIYFYFDKFDHAVHQHGPDTSGPDAVALKFWEDVDQLFLSQIKNLGSRTLLLVTADHGATYMDPRTTVYLDEEIPEITRYMRVQFDGKPIAPAGSARDLFLHVQPDCLKTVEQMLREPLQGVADVMEVKELIAEGFFGEPPLSERFMKNIGDLVVLPYEGRSVYWLGEGSRFRQTFRGHHGGLTPNEMEIPLLVKCYS